jgi:glycosyltransferase involved in cell wall biosynthesis
MNYAEPQSPLLSIVCTTYNHAGHIEGALRGFLAQITSFPCEICIGEDESSDGTREICQRCTDQYSDCIRLFLRSRKDVFHIDGRVRGRFNFVKTIHSTQGKYIAFCDGDDLWIDPNKLQKQVTFLEKYPTYSMTFHGCRTTYSDCRYEDQRLAEDLHTLDLHSLSLVENSIRTCTAVFRKSSVITHLESLFDPDILVADCPRWLLCAKAGLIKYFPDIMGVYRYYGAGLWSELTRAQELLKAGKLYLNLRKLFTEPISTNLTRQACRFFVPRMEVGFRNRALDIAKQSYDEISGLDANYWYNVMRLIFNQQWSRPIP